MRNIISESGEEHNGINVNKTENEEGFPTTIVEKGSAENSRIRTDFGREGIRYCTVLSDKVYISSGDAVVSSTADKKFITNVIEGSPTTKEVTLKNSDVQPIKSILVKEDSDGGFFSLLNRVESIQQVYEEMEALGIHMSRAEHGALSHKSDYTFSVDQEAEVYVNIGDRKYLKSEGRTTLLVSKGTVFLNSLNSKGNNVEVVVRIG